MISRRVFIGTVGFGLLVPRRRADAQASAKIPRVGYLGSQNPRTVKAFLDGLQELGHVAGQNFLLELRAPERPDKYEQFPGLAAQLVAAGVDVILAATPSAIEATTKATRTIPIVGVDLESDPVAKGWAATLAHPGLVVLTSPLVFNNLGRITDATVKHRLPAICPFAPAFADAGGLIAYGPDLPDLYRRAAGYVSKILGGARPGDLPVQRPEKFQLVVNLKAARALKLTLPQSLVLRADRVIE